MLDSEVSRLLETIEVMYPNTRFKNIQATVLLWSEYLANENSNEIFNALKKWYGDGNEFSPNAGQLIQMVRKAKSTSPLEGIRALKEALKNSSYGYVEEFEKLPEVVKKVIGSPINLHNLGQKGMNSYDESNYIRRIEEMQDVLDTREAIGVLHNAIGIEEKRVEWE